jgi:RND superfamily putative drug exporter
VRALLRAFFSQETLSMFKWLGRFTAAHPRKICAAWLVAGLLLSCLAPSWSAQTQDDDIHFLPARCDSVRGYELLKQAFPQEVFASRAIFVVERDDEKLTASDLELVDRMADDLNALRREEPDLGIGRIYSRRDPFIGKRLVSTDGQCALLQMSLATPYLALQTQKAVDRAEARLRKRLADAGADAPRLLTTGAAGLGRDLVSASDDSMRGTTIATVALVIVILLLVYRAPLLALVPLVTIGISVWIALKALALLTLIPGFYLVNVSRVFAIVLLYGAGTDYCLFLISRYREHLAGGESVSHAIRKSIGGVGGALTASAATVICGLALMAVAEFAKVRCAGPAIALSLAVVLIASLTLTPALLHILGAKVFWPRKQDSCSTYGPGIWERLSAHVVRRPILTWLVAVGLLLPFAVVGVHVRADYRPTGELAKTSGSIQGMESIQKHFTAGETGPITVLLASTTDWNSPQGQRLISHLSQGFARLDNVAEVRSLTQPLGTALIEEEHAASTKQQANKDQSLFGAMLKALPASSHLTHELARQLARQFYVADLPSEGDDKARHVTRLDVVLRSDPFDPRSQETTEIIQAWLRAELPHSPTLTEPVQAECYGVTVNVRDLAQVTDADRTRINALVLGAILLVLLIVVRRPWLAAYLLATVLLSYLATLGATALVGSLFYGRPWTLVDWRVPFFLFTILVAVGEDYNILLMARMLQERRRLGWEAGTRRALAGTGGTITSCGLIMAGTFATLMLANLSTLVQIGFALAFGVLLDTFLVRPFLVPAFILMIARLHRGPRREPMPPWRELPRRRAA